MTAWGGPLIILALVAVAWAVTDVLRGISERWRR